MFTCLGKAIYDNVYHTRKYCVLNSDSLLFTGIVTRKQKSYVLLCLYPLEGAQDHICDFTQGRF